LGNVAVLGNAVGISNSGTLTLTNSTVSDNEAFAIFVCGGTVRIANSTLHSAYAVVWNEVHKGCSGRNATITITSSVVVGPQPGGEGGLTSDGYNIESPGDIGGFDQEGDQVGVTAEELNLGPLQDNGGGTPTHALLPGSVAIDVIPTDDCVDADGEPLSTDQRGFPRDSMCDVGASEVQP
jgi:hypothetical protein